MLEDESDVERPCLTWHTRHRDVSGPITMCVIMCAIVLAAMVAVWLGHNEAAVFDKAVSETCA